MNVLWYINRIQKMSLAEILKRILEYFFIYFSQIRFRNPGKWPYRRFADNDIELIFYHLPHASLKIDWSHYKIFNYEFDLTKPIDWYFTGNKLTKWPKSASHKINYRPGNPYGDIRINWELNRLQFLPVMSACDGQLAKSIIIDWLEKNPYLHGPSYLNSMEVALRWISIYWAVCLFEKPLEKSFIKDITGLAVASGKFIESHLSTHSSAGNHLIIETVGLAWIGKALESNRIGQKWLAKARKILWEQTVRQLNDDGTNKEQTFWYLGFVLDALFHYLLIEDKKLIPQNVLDRMQKATEFIYEMIGSDGSFPDYGDRDDGVVFRINTTYEESTFPGLLNTGALLFERPEWYMMSPRAQQRLMFWSGNPEIPSQQKEPYHKNRLDFPAEPVLKTYPDGGMTLMKWGKGRLLFRHAPLGLEPTYGHGHADALSIIFSWGNTPVLIDLGSGQYNGDQGIRRFFRSTIAHNTLEIEGLDQAKMLGPFLWDKSYQTNLTLVKEEPSLVAQAYHTGYKKKLNVIHNRQIEWINVNTFKIEESFSGSAKVHCRGAFHLGDCEKVVREGAIVKSYFNGFIFYLTFPDQFDINIYYGSLDPIIGWNSVTYGKWEAIYSIIFITEIDKKREFSLEAKIHEY